MKMTVKAAAKINLFLDILRRLDNGYHSLFMIMQSVGLYDTVTVERTDGDKTEISCDDPEVPCDERNIVYKAVEKFFGYCGINGQTGLKISIEKKIPSAAGLAGGSSDGAAVIYALNELFDAGLSQRELCEIGVKVGADVPFCLTGGTMLAQNIGEVLSPLPPLPEYSIVLAKPSYGVSTKEAFAAFDSGRFISHSDPLDIIFNAANGDYEKIFQSCQNTFEQLVEVPDRVAVKSVMRENNCECCMMSGSGPSVFGIFKSKEDAENCAGQLDKFIKNVFVCSPVSDSLLVL